MTRRVLKLGGSLLPQTGWREALTLLVQRLHEPLVIVPGGGVFADAVRHAQATIGFDERAAHEMAILAMAQTACVLRDACPGLPLAATPQAVEAAWATQAVVVWQPTVMPDTPASWDISADSLAAWLAAQVGARELVLVKSCELPEPARSQGCGAQAQAAWRRWAQAGVVDGCFANYAQAAGAEVRLLRLNDVPGWVQDLPGASTSQEHAGSPQVFLPPRGGAQHPMPMLYPASVPLFLRYLERLDGLVAEAERFATASGREQQEVLQARLAADMLPFAAQVMIAANFALRACCPLAGRAVPPFPGIPASFEAMRRELRSVRERVAALQASDFVGAEARVLREKAGDADLELPAWEFLQHFALPNFFFHFTSAYAILRSLGAKIGKAHFDGLHVYPARP